MGRPVVLDKFTKAQVVGMITGGISQRTAAAYLRIHPSTISKAIKRDASFRKEIIRALAAAQVIPLTRVKRASEKSWRAATWLLKNAQPVTDLTQREERRQQRKRAREIEAPRPTTAESAADAVEWLDCVSDEIDKRQAAKRPEPLESLAELPDEPLVEKLRRSVEEAAERAGDVDEQAIVRMLAIARRLATERNAVAEALIPALAQRERETKSPRSANTDWARRGPASRRRCRMCGW